MTNSEFSGNNLVLCVLCHWLCPHLGAEQPPYACLLKATWTVLEMLKVMEFKLKFWNLAAELNPVTFYKLYCVHVMSLFILLWSVYVRVFQKMERDGGGRLLPVLPQGQDWRYWFYGWVVLDDTFPQKIGGFAGSLLGEREHNMDGPHLVGSSSVRTGFCRSGSPPLESGLLFHNMYEIVVNWYGISISGYTNCSREQQIFSRLRGICNRPSLLLLSRFSVTLPLQSSRRIWRASLRACKSGASLPLIHWMKLVLLPTLLQSPTSRSSQHLPTMLSLQLLQVHPHCSLNHVLHHLQTACPEKCRIIQLATLQRGGYSISQAPPPRSEYPQYLPSISHSLCRRHFTSCPRRPRPRVICL